MGASVMGAKLRIAPRYSRCSGARREYATARWKGRSLMDNSSDVVFKVSIGFKIMIITLSSLLVVISYHYSIANKVTFLGNLQHKEAIQYIIGFELFILAALCMARSFSQRVSIEKNFFHVMDIFSDSTVPLAKIRGYRKYQQYSSASPIYYLLDDEDQCIFTLADRYWPDKFENQSQLIAWIEALRQINDGSKPFAAFSMKMPRSFVLLALILFSLPLQVVLLEMAL
jgi:hypothetical protein